MIKQKQRPVFERFTHFIIQPNGMLSNSGILTTATLMSAALMAVTLNISTHSHLPIAYELPLNEQAAAQNSNVRHALIDAWKELHNKPKAGADLSTQQQVAQPVEPVIVYPFTEQVTVEVQSGDTMAEILQQHHIGIQDTTAIIKAMKSDFNPRKIRVGQTFDLTLNHIEADKAELEMFSAQKSRLSHVELKPKATGEGFESTEIKIETNKQIARAGGTIRSSFYDAGDDAGIPTPILMELTKAYSYDIDFERDVKPGQELEVLFEQLVAKDNGDVVGHGDLKYAAYTLKNDEKLEIYKFTDKSGDTDYYKPNGESIRKALLKTPVKARISSNFGMRKHPILGYSRMHTGIDFAAGSGTPIYAAGDGQLNYVGRKGGYGNFVKIKHNNGYETAYAHMQRFAKGMRNGRQVKQGDVIGYVGSTGRSTGPHLHYEIIKNGKHINPNGAKFRTGRVLEGTELANFKKQKQTLKNQLASLPRVKSQVAQAHISPSTTKQN